MTAISIEAPEAAYRKALSEHEARLAQAIARRRGLGWMRLLVFLLASVLTYAVFETAGAWGILPLIAGLALLLRLVALDVTNNARIRHEHLLIAINEEELRCLEHRFSDRYDGAALEPHEHPYAHDLDLFGPSSLYQWIQRCGTEGGQLQLARDLLSAQPADVISERQELTQELAPELAWRQEFYARARRSTLRLETKRKATEWVMMEEKHFVAAGWKLFVPAYSAVMLLAVTAAIAGWLPVPLFSMLYGTGLAFSLLLSRNTVHPYLHLDGIVPEIGTLHGLLEHIESKSFTSSLWTRWTRSVRSEGRSPSTEIRSLKSILDRFDLRLNIVGLLALNPLLLWDARQMIALNAWQKRNRAHLEQWFDLVAEAEVWNTIATLRFNQPAWCRPQFREPHFYWSSEEIGHPLIPAGRRVANDLSLAGTGKVALVTGSNMAGKSTFLRSLGVNSILAHMGAPACARSLTLSHHRLMSSMRIADNLSESTSTFYAELKKIKSVIDAANWKEPVFILLDEILRGTNSHDRHTGSEALVRQLVRKGAVAILATHDVALGALAESVPGAIENYHFDVQVAGEELYFDYRLKHGVCTSLNASILMRKIGIELDESGPSDLHQ